MSKFKGMRFGTNSWAVDFDYLHKLSKEDDEWLFNFAEGHYNGGFPDKDSVQYQDETIRKECYRRNERAQWCTLNNTNPISTINTNEGYKDIFDIDDTNPNTNYKNDSSFYYQPHILLEKEVNSKIIKSANYRPRKRRRTMQEINRELLVPITIEDVSNGYKGFYANYFKQYPILMSFDWNSILEKEIA